MAAEKNIVQEFRKQAGSAVELHSDGRNRYTILTPLAFDDGDLFPIVLKREGDCWWLSDEGGSLMHLSYKVDEADLRKGTRRELIERTVEAFALENREGELRLRINGQGYGAALYNFLHALAKIDDVRFLSHERVKSAFAEDFRHFVETKISEEHRYANWHHPQKDPGKRYAVDYRVNGRPRPILLFALPTPSKIALATISILKLKSWGVPGEAVGIFENQAKIPPQVTARFVEESAAVFPDLVSAAQHLPERFPDVVAPS